MIYEVKMFSGKCDNCGKEYHEEHNGWSAMDDIGALWELMDNDGWVQYSFKHYCPDCVMGVDENDKPVLK